MNSYIRSDRLTEERGHDVWYEFKDEAREKEEEAIKAAMSKDAEKFNKEKDTMNTIIMGLKAGQQKASADRERLDRLHAEELARLKAELELKHSLAVTASKQEAETVFGAKINALTKDLAAAEKKNSQLGLLQTKHDAVAGELQAAKRKLEKLEAEAKASKELAAAEAQNSKKGQAGAAEAEAAAKALQEEVRSSWGPLLLGGCSAQMCVGSTS